MRMCLVTGRIRAPVRNLHGRCEDGARWRRAKSPALTFGGLVASSLQCLLCTRYQTNSGGLGTREVPGTDILESCYRLRRPHGISPELVRPVGSDEYAAL